MPKKVADSLNIKYEPMSRGVVQLDGTVVETVGVIKEMILILHACPIVSILQGISVIDFPPYFAICISRYSTTKIGGYMSSDWSHLLFRTRYGTKVTVRVDSISRNHVEPYTLSPISTNQNCIIYGQEEDSVGLDRTTCIKGTPDVCLDEWVNHFQFDTCDLVEEIGLGTYCIHEENSFIPNFMKPQEDSEGNWQMYFDGSKSRNGIGARVMLISPNSEKYLCFQI